MSKLVTIFGGSGFVGRYVAQRMAARGWRVRVAVRRPNEALFVMTYGVVGQVEPVLCNIRDDASVAAAAHGADALVNCVGILSETGRNKFGAVHAEGAGRIARIAAEQGIERLVHVSSIAARADSDSDYARTKAEGEANVLAHMPDAVILRPSLIFGAEDRFFNKFATMTRYGLILPIVGARTRFQPVWVDDVAQAAEMAALGQAAPGNYELGGPDICSFRELMQEMLRVIQRRRLIIGLPFWVARLVAFGFDMMQTFSLGLIHNSMLTRDQVRSLRHDSVVAEDARGFGDLGIDPVAIDAVLPEYLWRFRKDGQYAAIRDSAGNLGT